MGGCGDDGHGEDLDAGDGLDGLDGGVGLDAGDDLAILGARIGGDGEGFGWGGGGGGFGAIENDFGEGAEGDFDFTEEGALASEGIVFELVSGETDEGLVD